MKTKWILLLPLWLLLLQTAWASPSPSILLNGMPYVAKEPLYLENDMLYVSLDDLISLTYGTYTQNEQTCHLNIQNQSLVFSPFEPIVKLNNKPVSVSDKALIQRERVYVPFSFLDLLGCDYSQDSSHNSWSITPLPPYSKTSDDYAEHKLLEAPYEKLIPLLTKQLGEKEALEIIQHAKQKNAYISFIDNRQKINLLREMRDLVGTSTLQVAFRNIDLFSPSHNLSTFTLQPMTLQLDEDYLTLRIGKEVLRTNCFWTTYYPTDETHKLDASQTLDATIVQLLYKYYRDQMDLKDDRYISPIMLTQTDRTETFSQNVYWDNEPNEKAFYTVSIYQTLGQELITYYVDIKR